MQGATPDSLRWSGPTRWRRPPGARPASPRSNLPSMPPRVRLCDRPGHQRTLVDYYPFQIIGYGRRHEHEPEATAYELVAASCRSEGPDAFLTDHRRGQRPARIQPHPCVHEQALADVECRDAVAEPRSGTFVETTCYRPPLILTRLSESPRGVSLRHLWRACRGRRQRSRIAHRSREVHR